MGEPAVIVLAGVSQVCLLQACMIAKKQHIPVLWCVTQTPPYGFDEVKKTLAFKEIASYVKGVITVSERLKKLWQICLKPFHVDVHRFSACMSPSLVQEARHKAKHKEGHKATHTFRHYLGLSEHEPMIFLYGLESDLEDVKKIFAAFCLLQCSEVFQTPLKFLISGPVASHAGLHTLAHESGRGHCFYFMKQDIAPFLQDMIQSMDAVILTPRQSSECGLVYRALRYQKALIVPAHHVCIEAFPGRMASYVPGCPEEIAWAIELALSCPPVSLGDTYADQYMATQDAWFRLCTSLSRVSQVPHVIPGMLDLDVLNENIRASLSKPASLSELYYFKGLYYAEQHQIMEAIEYLEKSCQIKESGRAYLKLGDIARASLALHEASIFYQKALSFDLNDDHASYGLGLTYLKLNMGDQALPWLEQCMLYDSHNTSRMSAYTQALQLTKDLDAALASIGRMVGELDDLSLVTQVKEKIELKRQFFLDPT
jgi:tetratricopeptide (TPR) repeat protein